MILNGNPILVCFKGGGGSSGGTTGAVDYPDYMKTFHAKALDNNGIDSYALSIVDVTNNAMYNSPYTGVAPYNPDTDITAWLAEISEFNDLVDLLSSGTPLDNLIAHVLDESRITDSVNAFATRYDDDFTARVQSRFEGGMRDINAVISSAFVIGRAILTDGRDKDVAKYDADLRYKVFGDDAIKLIALKLQYKKLMSDMTLESRRIKIVAKKEQLDSQLVIDEKDALWDLEIYKYGANFLASIAGAAVAQGAPIPGASMTQSAIGGALAGAGIGTMIAPGVGTVIGGVVGAAAGLLGES
jgi:hypothetical protein